MTRPKQDKPDAIREAALDETLAATFPASDPLSTDPNPAAADEPVGQDGDQDDEQARDDDATSGNRHRRSRSDD
jgi:hypothetical protein